MNFRSIHDMNQAILNNLPKVPEDVEVIVGVPRSGILAASMLALHRNLVLTEVDGLIHSRVMSGGSTTHPSGSAKDCYLHTKRKVLVIDDSYFMGMTIRGVKERIREANLRHEIYYAVVYGDSRAKDDIDIVFESIRSPHVFEWNLSRNVILRTSCLDMDGVLCRNPKPFEDDDGKRYEAFMRNAELLWRPERKVGWIVTGRIEKYREITVQWLRRHCVEYDRLVMMDVETLSARRRVSVSQYKARVLDSTGADLFIESSLGESLDIALRTGKNVFCFERAEFIPASRYEDLRRRFSSPAKLVAPIYRSVSDLLRNYPDTHPIVGPLKRSGRWMFRALKQMGPRKDSEQAQKL